MQFEELSGIWNSTDTELEKSVRINRELVKQLGFSKIKSHLFEIKGSAIFEIIAEAIFTVFLISFTVDYIRNTEYLLPALVLLVFSLFSLIIEIIKLKVFVSINSSETVFEAQQKLSRLKYLEFLDIYSLYIIMPFYLIPFLIVIAKAFFNLNLYDLGIMDWLTQAILGGLVIAAITVYSLRKYRGRKLEESISFLRELQEE